MKKVAVVLLLTTLPSSLNLKSSPSCFLTYEERLWAHIDRRARYYGFQTRLIHRIIEEESAWNSTAISPKKAYGIMQLLLPTAREVMMDRQLTREDLLNNPFLNVEAGIRYLSWLREHFDGDMRLALAAYNRGMGRVRRDLVMGRNPENEYVKRVLR